MRSVRHEHRLSNVLPDCEVGCDEHLSMDFADIHTRAAVHQPFRVCGMPMLPMTVGHARILDALGLWSAVEPQDVFAGAWICSRPHGEFSSKWGTSGTRLAMRFWLWRLGRSWDWRMSALAWNQYVQHHREEIAATFKASQRKMVMPWLAHLRATLCARLGYNPQTFDDAPLAQAMIDYYAYAELEDAATLVPASVSEFTAAIREKFATRN